jgi:hypothetical protein
VEAKAATTAMQRKIMAREEAMAAAVRVAATAPKGKYDRSSVAGNDCLFARKNGGERRNWMRALRRREKLLRAKRVGARCDRQIDTMQSVGRLEGMKQKGANQVGLLDRATKQQRPDGQKEVTASTNPKENNDRHPKLHQQKADSVWRTQGRTAGCKQSASALQPSPFSKFVLAPF